jgi:hypothetical protein
MSTRIDPDRPAGGHGFSWRMEVHMNNLFSAHWNSIGAGVRPQEIDCSRPSGFGRLLAAVAVIGIAVVALDHAAAGKDAAGTLIAYGSSEQGSWK